VVEKKKYKNRLLFKINIFTLAILHQTNRPGRPVETRPARLLPTVPTTPVKRFARSFASPSQGVGVYISIVFYYLKNGRAKAPTIRLIDLSCEKALH